MDCDQQLTTWFLFCTPLDFCENLYNDDLSVIVHYGLGGIVHHDFICKLYTMISMLKYIIICSIYREIFIVYHYHC